MRKSASKQYFVSKTSIIPAINGRYGLYGKLNRFNYSEKDFAKMGYELRSLTDDEVNDVMAAQKAFAAKAKANSRALELEVRAKQVEICLASEPLAIGEGNNLWLHITDLEGGHREAYSGCGLATAYIADGKIIAWHYGNERPANAPVCDYVQLCEVSCSQILF